MERFIQREFMQSLTVQAGYVGQHSDHLAAIYDMGQNVLLPNGTRHSRSISGR